MSRLLVVGLAAATVLSSCGAPPEPVALRQSGGIWLARTPELRTQDLPAQTVARLAGAGLRQWFVDSGELLPGGQMELASPRIPDGASDAHLVFRLTPRSLSETFVDQQADALRARVLDMQNKGLLIQGLMFDGTDINWGPVAWESLEQLRQGIADLALGLRLPRDIEIGAVEPWYGRAFDYLVLDFYGQSLGDVDREEAWEIDRGAARLSQWTRADIPILPLVWLRGHAQIEVPATKSSHQIRRSSQFPREVMRAVSGQASAGFSFEGFDRQQVEVELAIRREIRIGEATGYLPAGTTVSISRPTRTHLRRVLAALVGQDDVRRPALFAAPVAPADALGLSPEDLTGALNGEAEDLPLLELQVEYASAAGELTVELTNHGETTGVGVLQHNFVEIRVVDGFIRQVQPGGFQRYRLAEKAFPEEGETRTRRLPRNPSAARLYHPLVERGMTLDGARVSFGKRPTRIAVEAVFRDAAGRDVSASWEWPVVDSDATLASEGVEESPRPLEAKR